jgi:2-dehydropantoate 2-reductase
MPSPLKASMLRDLHRGATTECEHIIGDLIGRGSAHGIDMPLLCAAATHLRVYERGRNVEK